MSSYDSSGSGSDGGSLAARRARLRGSLARASYPPDEPPPGMSEPTVAQSEPAPIVEQPKVEPKAAVAVAEEKFEPAAPSTTKKSSSAQVPSATAAMAQAIAQANAPAPAVSPAPSTKQLSTSASGASKSASAAAASANAAAEAAVEMLSGIDTALNACATNLAALQRLSVEQTEVLKGLTTTLQTQTLFEIGLNLNSLTESFTAALEPMKAIGELVPAMDQLVSTLEGGREHTAPSAERLSPDQLVTSLADQLSAGLIDPWTFKCAYMAIYPSEHPADLLHRLVELLGTQRLSGDLFRAAYEAVQAAEPPANYAPRAASVAAPNADQLDQLDTAIKAQLDQLQRANEELQKRQEEREKELGQKLSEKERELQEAQDMLNSRLDEFNSRYEEVADVLSKREDQYKSLLESKEMEIVEKESELNLLRAQMEELRNQMEEMAKDMQRQMKAAQESVAAAPKTQSTGFFDTPAQATAQYAPPPPPPKPAFEAPQAVQSQTISQAMPVVQPPQGHQESRPAVAPQPVPTGSSPLQQALSAPMQAPQPAPQQQPSQQARPSAPQPAPTTPFGSGAGSYGSGVRAQVFEVIVRQALAGAPWREICSGPMQVNNISPDEVEAEVRRRQALLNK